MSMSISRQTHTEIELHKVHRGYWELFCIGKEGYDPHSGHCEFTSKQLALKFAPVPMEWCEDCMEEAKDRQ